MVSCSSCAYTAPDWSTLRSHFQSDHEYCLLHDCKYCDHFFTCTQDRKDHLVSVHGYIQCECSKVFRYQGRLDLHMRLEHGIMKKGKTESGNYTNLKDLTDEYIQKIRSILSQEKCENLGGLHSSLEQFISSEASGKLGQDSQMAVLAFVMHAAEIAITAHTPVDTRPLPTAPTPVPKPPETVSISPESGRFDPPSKPGNGKMRGKAGKEPKTEGKVKTVKIFVTESVNRTPKKRAAAPLSEKPAKARKVAVQPEPPTPVQEIRDWQMYQYPCETCGEAFSSRAEVETHKYQLHRKQEPFELQEERPRHIQCSIDGCPELFEDENELLTHLRIAHNNT